MDLPSLHRFDAPHEWRAIDFISDLHLSAAQPRTFDAWSAYLAGTDADAVFMLGDLFEVWVGDDARHGDFERRCVNVLRDAASERSLAFMAGNRDFLVGAGLLREAGVMSLQDPTLLCAWDAKVLLTHGDMLCLSDVEYQRFRAVVRGDEWRRDFLARPLAERQQIAQGMRDASETAKRSRIGPWSDVDAAAAVAWLKAAGASEMVHGHTHRPASEPLAPGFMRHVLTDWDLDATPPRAGVLRLSPEGFVRHPLPA